MSASRPSNCPFAWPLAGVAASSASLAMLGTLAAGGNVTPLLAAFQLVLSLTLGIGCTGALIRLQRTRSRVVVRNGLGFDLATVELTPGAEVRIEIENTFSACDRGLQSKDGKHRLGLKTYAVPLTLSLEHPSNPGIGPMPNLPR